MALADKAFECTNCGVVSAVDRLPDNPLCLDCIAKPLWSHWRGCRCWDCEGDLSADVCAYPMPEGY